MEPAFTCVYIEENCPETPWETVLTQREALYLLDTDVFYQMLYKTQGNHCCVLILFCLFWNMEGLFYVIHDIST